MTVVVLCSALFSFGLVTVAAAASITVTTPVDGITDDGECTLREAILNANNDDQSGDVACVKGSGADTILLDDDNYVLSNSGPSENASVTGDLDISSDITIKPADAQGEPTIDGGGSASTFVCDGGNGAGTSDRVLHVTAGTLVLQDLRVRHGVIETAVGPTSGGGVFVEGGHLDLTRSIVEDNAVCTGPTLDSSAFGGGIAVGQNGSATILDSTIQDNRAIATGDTQGAHAQGGGLWFQGAASTVDGSTIKGNETVVPSAGTNITSTGGGIWDKGPATIVNSTISGNESLSGGGIHFTTTTGANLVLQYVTITDNDEQGIATGGADNNNSTVQAHWTIVDDNGGDQCVLADPDHMDSLGYNLSSDDSCSLDQTGDIEDGDAALASLDENGGSTETHLLLEGSDAIDAIPSFQCSLTVDQRDESRPVHGACDMGAVELQSEDPGGPPPDPGATPTPTPTASSSPSATPSATPTQAPVACGDGTDNDQDGKTDFPTDAGCSSASDRSEGSEGTGGGGGGGGHGVKERRVRATISLEWLPGADRFKGKVTSKEGTCRKHRLVKLFRIDTGPNTFIGKDRTNDRGRFVVPADGPDFGRYMAKAPKKTRTQDSLKLICLPAKSEPVQT
jgi:CSLREA domain-containing protein